MMIFVAILDKLPTQRKRRRLNYQKIKTIKLITAGSLVAILGELEEADGVAAAAADAVVGFVEVDGLA